jgi:hypothetical protein
MVWVELTFEAAMVAVVVQNMARNDGLGSENWSHEFGG